MSRSDDYLDEFKQVLDHIVQSEKDREVQSEKDREIVPPRRLVREQIQPKLTKNPKVRHDRKSLFGLVAIQTVLMVGAFFFVRDYFGEGVVSRTITSSIAALTAPRTEEGPFKAQTGAEAAIADSSNQTELFKDDSFVIKPAMRKAATRKVKPFAVASASSAAVPLMPKLKVAIPASKTPQVRAPQQLATSGQSPVKTPDLVEIKAMALLPSTSVSAPQKVFEPNASLASDSTFRDCENCPEMLQLGGSAGQPAFGLNEVTFIEWEACVDDGGCKTRPFDNGWGGGDRPVINVSYNMIVNEYLPWIAGKTKARYRLPTEAEWDQLAKRARNTPAQSVETTGVGITEPVSELPARSDGFTGVIGNVWEWVDGCRISSFGDETSDAPCKHRIVRGGAWTSEPENLNAEARGWESISKTSSALGFRVVRDPSLTVGEIVSP